jgi:type III restriction enzyme
MGRWDFAEFTDKWTIQTEFEAVIRKWIDRASQVKEPA